MGIDLRRAVENNAVLINHVDLAGRLDLPVDLGWRNRRTKNPVKCHPVARTGPAGALVKVEYRVFADVERRPVEQSLRRILRDGIGDLPGAAVDRFRKRADPGP